MNDLQTIYLIWLAVSPMKAGLNKWTTKKTGQHKDVKEFFNGKTFSKGNGIGSIIMAAVQYICTSLVEWQPPIIYPNYQTILLQSSFQALEFYKVALGFTEITDTSKIGETVQEKFIVSHQIIPIKVIGLLHQCWLPKMTSKQHIMGTILICLISSMTIFLQNYVYYQDAYSTEVLQFIIQKKISGQ
jgi:magnesium-transporting ATPase (P-type)